jgi:nitrogen fixation protein NifU and related proteins
MLDELYQDVIMDHNARPKHYGRLKKATKTAKGFNPICGDTIIIDIHQGGDGHIAEVAFESNGCAISKAAASIMTESVNTKSEEEIEVLMNNFIEMTTTEMSGVSFESDGDMAAFSGVRMYPSRIKCANLPWHTLKAALQGEKIASTE